MSKTTQLSTVILTESEQRQMGEQLTEQYRRAQSAQLEIITFGAMCIEAEMAISGKCATVFGVDDKQLAPAEIKHIGGASAKGQGLKGWLAQYAPGVEYTKARRYRDVAEALVSEFHLAGPEQLKQLTGSGDLDEKLTKKREKLFDFVTNKSVRGLQLELGLTTESPRGGARTKAETMQELTEAQKREVWVKAARENALLAFDGIHGLGDRWKLLDDLQLALALKEARALAALIDLWLKTEPTKRPLLDVEQVFAGQPDLPATAAPAAALTA